MKICILIFYNILLYGTIKTSRSCGLISIQIFDKFKGLRVCLFYFKTIIHKTIKTTTIRKKYYLGDLKTQTIKLYLHYQNRCK